MFSAPLVVVLLPFLYLTNLIDTSTSQQQPDFQQMFGSLLSGVQSALKEIQKPKGSGGNDADDEDDDEGEDGFAGIKKLMSDNPVRAALGPSSGGNDADDEDDDEGEDGFAGIKKLMESIDTEKVGQFIQNFANPAKLMSWLPMKFQDYIPEGWREKIITIITSELDKLAAVWDALAKYKTLEHVWKALKRNTPTLASLLEDAWKIIKQRWAKFNGGLEPEAKEYMHDVSEILTGFVSGTLRARYIVKGAICALSLCEQNLNRKIAFGYLEDVAIEFLNQYGTQVASTTRPYHFLEF
uniref:Longin domain-containing protein n=1 Tax=Meloidogyne floridensis TaxID=298350 RepID=A0A915PB04_9BILA